MAASAAGVRAGAAFVEIVADSRKFLRGLDAASKRLKRFGSELRAIGMRALALGGALTGTLLYAVKSFAERGQDMMDLSRKTGMTVEALSALEYAAKKSKVEFDTVGTAIKFMQKNLVAAASGSRAQNVALQNLGLTVKDLQRLAPDEQFALIAQRLSMIENPAKKTALAMMLFGRSGQNILPMVDSLEESRKEAERLGLIMKTEDAEAGEQFRQILVTLWVALQKITAAIGAALIPVLQPLAQDLIAVAIAVRDWIRQNKNLIVMALYAGGVLVGLGIAVSLLGGLFTLLGWALGLVSTAFGVLSAVISIFSAVIAIASGAVAFFKAVLAGDVIAIMALVIAVFLACIAALAYFTGSIQEATNTLGALFGTLLDTVKTTMEGIFNAIKAGDFQLAAEIAWAGLKVAWIAATNWVSEEWHNFWDKIIIGANDAWSSLIIGLKLFWYELKIGWEESMTFIRKLWTDIKKIAETLWNAISGTIMNAIAGIWNKIADLIERAPKWLRDLAGIGSGVGRMNYTDIEKNKSDIKKRAADEKAAIDKEHNDKMRTMVGELNNSIRKTMNGNAKFTQNIMDKEQARKKEHDKALADAQKELNDLSAKAAQKAKEAQKATEDTAQAEKSAKDYKPDFDVAGLALQQAANVSVMGTFSGEAAARLGVSSKAAERTAKATEDTAKWTKLLYENIDSLDSAGDLEFS